MLPLRLFLGLTFVYAGLDKLLFDPTFLDSAAPTSLLAQLQGFAHTSPLAPLITLIAEPLVVPIGLAMAVAEIAVGLGRADRPAAASQCMGRLRHRDPPLADRVVRHPPLLPGP